MIARCQQAGLPAPEFRQEGGQFIQTLWRPAPEVTLPVAGQVTAQVTAQVTKTLEAASEAAARETLQAVVGMKHREHFRKAYLEPLLTAGWLERTIPGKPTSRLQKYRLTDKGRAWLVRQKPTGDAT